MIADFFNSRHTKRIELFQEVGFMITRMRILGVFLICMLGAVSFPSINNSYAQISKDLLQEARNLINVEQDYFQKRMASDWPAIYDQQHPAFKKRISYEEFVFYDGRIAYDFWDWPSNRVSGGALAPSKQFIRDNQGKKDMLGFPALRKYKMASNPLVTIERSEIEKVSISKNGLFAKVTSRYYGKETLHPAIVKAIMVIPFEQTFVDYWEKVDGKWKITILQDPASISGNTLYHLIPYDLDAWDHIEFVDISASAVTAKKKS